MHVLPVHAVLFNLCCPIIWPSAPVVFRVDVHYSAKKHKTDKQREGNKKFFKHRLFPLVGGYVLIIVCFSLGYTRAVMRLPSFIPMMMEAKAIPTIPNQKTSAFSYESIHLIAPPSSFVLLPCGSLGSGYTCSTHCSMLRLLPDSVDKVYTLLTSRVAVVLLDGFVGGVTHNE